VFEADGPHRLVPKDRPQPVLDVLPSLADAIWLTDALHTGQVVGPEELEEGDGLALAAVSVALRLFLGLLAALLLGLALLP